MPLLRRLQSYKGDSMEIPITLNRDITDWEIRAIVWDSRGDNRVYKATSNSASGGGDEQIEIISASFGQFLIHIEAGETEDFLGETQIEVEVTDTFGIKTTILQDFIELKPASINWTDIPSD